MRHNILFLFLSMNLFILINTTTIYGEWTPKLLYEYIVSNNDYRKRKYITNINYMIIDPENYLENADPSGLINKMKIIYDEYKINTYIILISDLNLIENNGDLNYEVERFVSYFNYLLQKYN